MLLQVKYTERLGEAVAVADCEEEEEDHHGGSSEYELWDMGRPLEGSCNIVFKTYDDAEGQLVFKHSSAHILGAAMEAEFGVKLCIGPPTEEGFYYDACVAMTVSRDFLHSRVLRVFWALTPSVWCGC